MDARAAPITGRLGEATLTAAYVAKHATLLGYAVALHAALPVGLAVEVDGPAIQAIRERFARLLADDLALARRRVLPPGDLLRFPWGTVAARLPRLLLDRADTRARRAANAWRALPAGVDLARFPPYFRRTFHWQRDGYLSDRSAALYDVGVELLFLGAADVMRRQVLPDVAAVPGRAPRVLDVACGTGRTLGWIHRARPDAELIGLDLSPWYLAASRRHLAHVTHLSLLAGAAEAIPLPDGHVDVVTSTWLLHELPPRTRRAAVAELVRVLRPGGTLVLLDAAQAHDDPRLAPVLRAFPRDFHEPYFDGWLEDPIEDVVREAGIGAVDVRGAWLSKVVVGRKGR